MTGQQLVEQWVSKNKNCLWLELLTAEHQSRRDFFAHDRNPEAIRETIDREFLVRELRSCKPCGVAREKRDQQNWPS